MAFNFGAFVGGLSESISEDIQEAQDKETKLELMAEQEATQMRLKSASERRTRKDIHDKITQGLSAYIGADKAGAVIKQYGVAGAEQFLLAAQNYDGDFATAVKLPELKNGVFGGDFANKPLMSLIPPEVVEPDAAKTHADWELRWLDEELTIARMPDGEKKTEAKTAHQSKLKNYYKLIADREEAKRETDDAGEDKPFYTNDQREKILKTQRDIAFSNLTGFAGARELSTQERSGSNVIPVSDYIAAINTYNQNEQGPKDKNLTNDARAAASTAFQSADNYANKVGMSAATKIYSDQFDGSLTFERREKKPSAVMAEARFNGLAENGSLDIGGVYLVKTNAGSLKVVTYLGFTDVFSSDENKINYIQHDNIIGIPTEKFNLLKEKYFTN